MIGISSVASAQNGEALRQKKEAAKKEANQPAFTNAANETAPVKATTPKEKTDAELAAKGTEDVKVDDSKKTDDIRAKVAEQKKASKPVAKKTKSN